METLVSSNVHHLIQGTEIYCPRQPEKSGRRDPGIRIMRCHDRLRARKEDPVKGHLVLAA
jgi:hypothetical protein